MNFTITKMGQGWTEMRLSHGRQEGTILASNIRDSPAELLSALVQLLRGSNGERVVFEAEPGYTVLNIRRLSGDMVRIEDFGGPSEDDDPNGPPWLVVTQKVQHFARGIRSEFARLLRELGPDGYARSWGSYGFPRRSFDTRGKLLEEYR